MLSQWLIKAVALVTNIKLVADRAAELFAYAVEIVGIQHQYADIKMFLAALDMF